jgi:asparagine synthase (glutamine-hydrolysing)
MNQGFPFMPVLTSDLSFGRPHFADPAHEELSSREGAMSAWRAAFARDGLQAPADAQGNFAVGVTLPDGRTFLAVDRFAVRTLCYRLLDGRLHMAERADDLAALSPRAAIDPQALYDYLYYHVIPSPRTIFDGVYRVPPGHVVLFESGRVLAKPYWTPRFAVHRGRRFRDLAQEFRGLLREAVARQLDAGKPACFLSGGTDSSTVAGMIGLAAGRPAASYAIGFEAEGYDEMHYARIAAKRFGTEHHEYYVTPADVVQGMPLVAAQYDQPFGNSSAVPAYFCARMARDDGVVRLLAGDGGDELFGGNVRYAKQRVFNWYQRVPFAVRSKVLEPFLAWPAGHHLPLVRKAASYVEQSREPMPDRQELYNLLLRVGPSQVLEPALLDAVDIGAPLREQQAVWRHAEAASEIDRNLAFDWRYTLAESDLPKVCGSTALAGVGVGFPFLDDRLLAFSMSLPPEYKLKGLKLRWFFKEALRGFLPDEIIAKRKHGFGLPFGVWALRDEGLRGLSNDLLRSLGTRGVVQPDFVRRLQQDLLPAHPGYYGEMVWILAMLELWLRAHRPDFRLC